MYFYFKQFISPTNSILIHHTREMANHKKIIEQIKKHEGVYPKADTESSGAILCSNCFEDEGLKINAIKIGIYDTSKCPQCHSENGYKLTKELANELCYTFFVVGTIYKSDYGGAPLVQFNPQNFDNSSIDIVDWLANDVRLLEQACEIGLFYYGPRLWMIGEIDPLKSLQNDDEQNEVIEKILTTYPIVELTPKNQFYRLRVNPLESANFGEYDTAPDYCLGKNRFDSSELPVLYGSPDLELCIHECRTTIADDVFVAKLVPSKNLRVLDLSAKLEEEGITEFESLDIAIHFLFLAGNHSYSICRKIALKAKEKGFDGIIYPSYFSYARTGAVPFHTIYGISIRRIPQMKDYVEAQTVPNLALFGRPIKENKVKVQCINKVVINKISYDLSFGPTLTKS